MTNWKQLEGDDLKPGIKEQKEKDKSIALPKRREEKQDWVSQNTHSHT